jgi:hypothetical protein
MHTVYNTTVNHKNLIFQTPFEWFIFLSFICIPNNLRTSKKMQILGFVLRIEEEEAALLLR